jgi:hypothetical protein
MAFSLKKDFAYYGTARWMSWVEVDGKIYASEGSTTSGQPSTGIHESTDGGTTFTKIYEYIWSGGTQILQTALFTLESTGKVYALTTTKAPNLIQLKRYDGAGVWTTITTFGNYNYITDVKVRGDVAYFSFMGGSLVAPANTNQKSILLAYDGLTPVLTVKEIVKANAITDKYITAFEVIGADIFWAESAGQLTTGSTNRDCIIKKNDVNLCVLPDNKDEVLNMCLHDGDLYYVKAKYGATTLLPLMKLSALSGVAAEVVVNNGTMMNGRLVSTFNIMPRFCQMATLDGALYIAYIVWSSSAGGDGGVLTYKFDADEELELFDDFSDVNGTYQNGFFTVVGDELLFGRNNRFVSAEEVEPVPTPEEGTTLYVPKMQSLTFVNEQALDVCNTLQTHDNTLFCKQNFYGFTKANYLQKVAKCDPLTIQFQSDFPNHLVQLLKYSDNTVVDTYTAEIVEQNIGVPTNYDILIRAHSIVGQSRVYFNTGTIPLPLEVSNVFEIVNNLDGFNGNYSILGIQSDISLGAQYLVINAAYGLAASSSAAVGCLRVHHEPECNREWFLLCEDHSVRRDDERDLCQ